MPPHAFLFQFLFCYPIQLISHHPPYTIHAIQDIQMLMQLLKNITSVKRNTLVGEEPSSTFPVNTTLECEKKNRLIGNGNWREVI